MSYTFTETSSGTTVTGDPVEAEATVRSWFPDASTAVDQWLDDWFLQLREDRIDEPAATALGLHVAAAT